MKNYVGDLFKYKMYIRHLIVSDKYNNYYILGNDINSRLIYFYNRPEIYEKITT